MGWPFVKVIEKYRFVLYKVEGGHENRGSPEFRQAAFDTYAVRVRIVFRIPSIV